MMFRVQDAFQVELTLRSFFNAPTIAGLYEAIGKAKDSSAGLRAPAMVPVSEEGYHVKASSRGALELSKALKKQL